MTLDMSNTDKLNEFRLEARRLGIEVVSPDVNRSGVAFEVLGRPDRLRAVGAERSRNARRRTPCRGARRQAVRRHRGLRRSRRRADHQPQSARMPGAGRRLRQPRPGPRQAVRGIGRILAAAQERSERSASGIVDLFGGSASRRGCSCRRRPLAACGTAAARVRRRRHLSERPPDRRLRRACPVARRAYLEGIPRPAHGQPPVHRPNRRDGSTRQERRTRTGGRIGIVTLSDPTMQFEATVYQERLADWRDMLEPGHSISCRSAASSIRRRKRCAPASRRSSRSRRWRRARRMRSACFSTRPSRSSGWPAGSTGRGLGLRRRHAEGPRGGGQSFPGQYRVTPQVSGAIKAVPGVVHVEMA